MQVADINTTTMFGITNTLLERTTIHPERVVIITVDYGRGCMTDHDDVFKDVVILVRPGDYEQENTILLLHRIFVGTKSTHRQLKRTYFLRFFSSQGFTVPNLSSRIGPNDKNFSASAWLKICTSFASAARMHSCSLLR